MCIPDGIAVWSEVLGAAVSSELFCPGFESCSRSVQVKVAELKTRRCFEPPEKKMIGLRVDLFQESARI